MSSQFEIQRLKNFMNARIRIVALLVILGVAGIIVVALEFWHYIQSPPLHGIYSEFEMESYLYDSSQNPVSDALFNDRPMEELKSAVLNEKFESVRVVDQSTYCYSELPIDDSINLLTFLEKFSKPKEIIDNPSGLYQWVQGSIEIQYFTRVKGKLRLQISIGLVDDTSIFMCNQILETKDLVAISAVSKLKELAEKTLSENFYWKKR